MLTDHNYTHGHLEILAELFNAEALLQKSLGNKADGLVLFEKSLKLFSFADENYRIYSVERQEKMEQIRKRIAEIRQL